MPDRGKPRLGKRVFRIPGLTGSQARVEVDQELRHHLELTVHELMAEGWAESEAESEARRRFGDLKFTTDYCTQQTQRTGAKERRSMWLEDVWQDTKYGVRTLFRSRTYAVVVVVTLALGIAANTTIFSVMNPYLFRPLPFSEPSELVQIGGVDPRAGWDGGRFSAPQIADLVERSEVFEELGFYYYSTVNATGEGPAEVLQAGYMSGNLFRILGTSPLLGRALGEQDAGAGSEDVVVIGEALWEKRWNSDDSVLGSRIVLDGEAHTIVGVMPRSFTFPFGGLYLWLPAQDDALNSARTAMRTMPIGRLQSGTSLSLASAELSRVIVELGEQHPDADGQYSSVSIKPLREALNFAWDILQMSFMLLLGAVCLVLIIACLNVASLTLARSKSRDREVALRSALGAHRGRLVRQLVTESFLLALLGGALGVGLAFLATKLLAGLLPEGLFKVGEVSIDGRVLLFSGILTLMTPFLFAVAPAFVQARDSMSFLRSGVGAGTDRSVLRRRKGLVIGEVALAIVLVTGTGLMVRSLQAAMEVDVGFASSELLIVEVSPGKQAYPNEAALNTYFELARAEVERVPGVDSVGMASRIPLNHESSPVRYQRSERSADAMDGWPGALSSRVDGDYFDAMGIALVAGRLFQRSDYQESGGPILISQAIAEQLFPEGGAVGQTLYYGSNDSSAGTILGVVGEVQYTDLKPGNLPHIYQPLDGSSGRRRFLLVRTEGEPGSVSVAVGNALRTLAPDLPSKLRPYSEVLLESTLMWAVTSLFLGAFGLIAVLLAALGIYGLMAFSVAQRSREMGLRLALGAGAGELQRSVVWGGLKLVGIGLVIGVALAVGLAAAARAVLFGVSVLDPVTLSGVVVLFALVGAAAAALPARRAARVDPLQVLRSE